MTQYTLNLAHLYPDTMNIYGDRGNIMSLTQRCRWRNIDLVVTPITTGTQVDWMRFDMAFFGGGQDSGQAIIAQDFLQHQSEGLARAIEAGLVMLAICGGYQLLGHYFLTHTGERLPGVGILDIHTIGGKQRMIGNTVVNLANNPLGITTTATPYLVGFENHSGRTYHGKNVSPLGQVLVGDGDNGEDGVSGACYKNTIGCYLHGSLLPKNPHLADHLLTLALRRRYGQTVSLPPLALDDTLELHAHHTMANRLLKEHKKPQKAQKVQKPQKGLTA
jgi:CobQ-like glutamine amidotransferase family enzyme